MSQVRWSSVLVMLAAAGTANRPWRHLEVSLCDSHQGRCLPAGVPALQLHPGVAVLVGRPCSAAAASAACSAPSIKLVGPNWRWMGYMGILCASSSAASYSVVGAGPWAMRPWPWAVSSA